VDRCDGNPRVSVIAGVVRTVLDIFYFHYYFIIIIIIITIIYCVVAVAYSTIV